MAHRMLMLAACACALVATNSASAAPPATSDSAPQAASDPAQLQAATDVAKSYWNADPCGGEITLRWVSFSPTTNATSTWANPVSAYTTPEKNSSCTITFNSALQWDWVRFCSILVHEYGHLAGHPHADGPNDVMYPYYSKPLPECEASALSQRAAQPQLATGMAAAPTVRWAAKSNREKPKRALLVVVKEPRKDHRSLRGQMNTMTNRHPTSPGRRPAAHSDRP